MNDTDSSFAASPISKLFAAAAVACAALGASAETYTLVNEGSADSPAEWATPSNWSPTGAPGSEDSITWATLGDWLYGACLALDQDRSISAFASSYRYMNLYRSSGVESPVTLTILNEFGNGNYTGFRLNDGVKLVLPATCVVKCSPNDHNPTLMHVFGGAEANIYGNVTSRAFQCNVEANATLVFAPTSYAATSKSDSTNGSYHDHDEFNIKGGSASFPNGILMTGTSASSSPELFNHINGFVSFGGNFISTIPWTYTWSGGTLAITGDSTFGANVALIIPESASVSLDIASGKTFAAPGLSADSAASITVTGGGTFSIAPTLVPIILQNSSLGIATSGTYDLANVSVGSGAATIALTAFGATIDSLPAALASATFSADLSNVAVGTVILNSANPAVLAKVKADLDASAPEGMALVVSDTALSLEKDAGADNTISSTGDLLVAASWGGGTVPAAGSEVAVAGSGVVATYSGGTVPAWTSIEVKDGATLRISTVASDLPQIKLNKNATLEIAEGAFLTLSRSSDLVGIATATQVPVLSIASAATLNVPGGMQFANVNISLSGTIAATTAGGITFGYAAAGETTYFGLASDGGTISIEPGSGDYNSSPLAFCCPAVGGTVNAIGNLMLSRTTFLPNYTRGEVFPLTVDYRIGFNIGVNNPANVPFEVVFDNTQWGVLGSFLLKGGATFRLVNGGAYKNFESLGYWGRYGQIADNARIVVGSGSEFRLNALGDYGSNPLEVTPTTSGHQAIVVEAGGVFENYQFSGNGNGVFAVSNGVYTIYMPSIYNEHYSTSSGELTIYHTTNIPFAGFQSVSLGDDSTLTFSTRNKVFWDDGQFDEQSGDRVVKLADVPMTGGGSIALDNANVNRFGVIVTCGSNTATGSARVVAPGESDGETRLYFADGANWAGTVVAENVVLTNLTDGAAAATVAFGALDLAADFPVRVWKTGGVLTANDRLNVDSYTGEAKITFVAMDEALKPGDRFVLGKIKSTSALPQLGPHFEAQKGEPDDAGYCDVSVKYSVGLQLIIR